MGAKNGGSLARSAQPLPPPYQTSLRRFQRWVRDGMLRSALEALAEDLEERGGLGLSECFIDATFVVANRGRAGGKDQAGQGYEAHGGGRPLWPSSLRLRGECLSARGHPY